MAVRIKIADLRAIHRADIPLDGITVLSGVNGSGKSTVSSFTYEFLSGVLDYNDLVDHAAKLKYTAIGRTLFSAIMNLSGVIPDNDLQKIRNLLVPFLIGVPDASGIKDDLRKGLDMLMGAASGIRQGDIGGKAQTRVNAFYSALASSPQEKKDDGPVTTDPEEIKEKISAEIDSIEKEVLNRKSSRIVGVFQNFWKSMFSESLNPSAFNIEENGVPMFDAERKSVLLPNSFGNVIYVDTPMSLGEDHSGKRHWRELNMNVKNEFRMSSPFDYESVEEDGLLGGKSEWKRDKTSEGFVYTRKDGKSFDLLDCATGLKSFSIIQMLYREGRLNSRTLLILDEPEAHLHPQWIVEYARLIIMMHEKIGVKFLVASHSPDMVNAIKTICEKEFKEKTGEHLNFYLAKEVGGAKFCYDFIPLGTEIEPIFKSFNVALDRIDKYAE